MTAAGGWTLGASPGRAVVVGASSQIGAAVAVMLAELGFELSLWGRHQERLRRTRKLCRDLQVRADLTVVDVTDRRQLAAAAAAVEAQGQLGVMVWAAGIFDWAAADVADPARWDELIDVNLTSAAHASRLLLPALIGSAPSAVIFIGSASSRLVYPNNAAYVASKHGLAGLAGGIFLDVRDRGVKVSLVSPGLVAAGAGLTAPAATQPDSLLQPADVAAAVRFVVTFPAHACPTEIVLQPQTTPQPYTQKG